MTESLSIRKEKFIKVANEKGFLILTEYKNNKTKVLAKCKKYKFTLYRLHTKYKRGIKQDN